LKKHPKLAAIPHVKKVQQNTSDTVLLLLQTSHKEFSSAGQLLAFLAENKLIAQAISQLHPPPRVAC